MGIQDYFKDNKIKLLKYLITIVVIFFILFISIEILNVLFVDVYNTITLTYINLIIIINFIPEFSPYILNNYLIYIFPFLSNYFGRGVVYILIGLATVSPQLNNILNIGGYILIFTGLMCIYMNWLIMRSLKTDFDGNIDKNKNQIVIENNAKNIFIKEKNENKINEDNINEGNAILGDNMMSIEHTNNNDKKIEMKEL